MNLTLTTMKAQQKTTEGNWEKKFGKRGMFIISTRIDDKQKIVCQINDAMPPEEFEGNTNLIASAPEMLKTLKWLDNQNHLGYMIQ